MNILIDKIPPMQPDNTYVAIDLEIFKAELHKLHRPTTGEFACLTLCPDGENVYLITDSNMVNIALGRVNNCVWTIQNAQFDLTHLRRWANIPPRTRMWDTMLIERLLWSGYYDRFSLKDLARRYLGIYLEKEARETFSEAQELSPEQIEYAGRDAVVTYQVLQSQRKEVEQRKDVWKLWKEVDGPAVWAYLDFIGLRLDVNQWEDMAIRNQKMADELKASFDFNPASPKQVKDYLRSAGFNGIPSTGEAVLIKYISRKPNSDAAIVAQKVLEFRKFATLSSRYGVSMLDKYVENENDYHVVYSDIKVTGASTGRNSSSDPNLQNIPVREYPEFRKPWIARPGHKLIVADWSAQEARIHAYETQDKVLMKIFVDDKDVYTETYNLMYQASIEKSDPRRSEVGKPAFLGATYGQTAPGIAERYNMSLEDAEDMQHRFFKAFPGSQSWCNKQIKISTYVESVWGRRFWVNNYNDAHERNNLNHPHQSTAADMMKLAIVKMHQNWNFDCPYGVVIPVHDEVILDIPEELAPDVAKFVEQTMVEVAENMCPGVPFKASAVICDNWMEGK